MNTHDYKVRLGRNGIFSDRDYAEMFRAVCNMEDFNEYGKLTCEVCGRAWDWISPCALCNATRAHFSNRP